MVTITTAVQIALLVEGHKALQRELEEMQVEGAKKIEEVQAEGAKERAATNAKVAALEAERNKALVWGVLTLGSALISLVAWIGNKIIGGHIQ